MSTPDRRAGVDHPAHYGGAENTYEAIKVIEAWSLGFCLGNAVKYIARAGKKGGAGQEAEDLRKARWYLDREITRIESDGAVNQKTCDEAALLNQMTKEIWKRLVDKVIVALLLGLSILSLLASLYFMIYLWVIR